jgi:dihydrolipoamide dehydrogenase
MGKNFLNNYPQEVHMSLTEVCVPDIGDFKDVEIIELLAQVGDSVQAEDSLLTLESDKATMDIPSPQSGVIQEWLVQVGDRVSEGSPILKLAASAAAPAFEAEAPSAPVSAPQPASIGAGAADLEAHVVVLGSGPGGYTAAFRAADLGLDTILIEKEKIGGVCLNVGCIPSKALLHAAKVIDEAQHMSAHGIKFSAPEIDLDALRSWKDDVVGKLVGGLGGMSKQRKVHVMKGYGEFLDPYHIQVTDNEGQTKVVKFQNAIIAAGSVPVQLPFLPEDPRIVDSTGALELRSRPKKMLVIGGGIIGLEMATVYHALGAEITVVEMANGLMLGADRDIVRPYQKWIAKRYPHIWLETRVTQAEALDEGIRVTFEGKHAPAEPQLFDLVLSAVGRVPNGKKIAADKAGVAVDERGFIATDSQMRTNVPHIFAIGDIIGQPMLAHKATHEGKVAAEVCSGLNSHFDARVIPSVAYTDPEVAWVGLTEEEAKQQGIAYGKGVFPWAASGRSLALGREEGVTKVIFDEATDRILGMAIVGPSAGDLIAEGALAIEMGCEASDIGSTIHPHPTLSETVAMAAEAFEGTITDLYIPKKKPAKKPAA